MTHIQRNALCPCGSDKKYKKCCLAKKMTQEVEANNKRHERIVAYLQKVKQYHAKKSSPVIVESNGLKIHEGYVVADITMIMSRHISDVSLPVEQLAKLLDTCCTALELYKL